MFSIEKAKKWMVVIGTLVLMFFLIGPNVLTLDGKNLHLKTERLENIKPKDFKVFDANNYKNAPDLTKYGLSPIAIIYEQFLTTKGKNGSVVNDKQFRDNASYVDKKWNRSNSKIPVCLDIESWNEDKKSDDYIHSVNLFKKYYNSNNVGLWNISSVKLIKNASVLFPQFYNRSPEDLKTWTPNFLKTIQKIKQLNSRAPIYAFLSPQYTSNGHKQFLSYAVWMQELKMVYKYCDGVVIWGMPYYDDHIAHRKVFFSWNSNREWWKATLDFMRINNIHN